MTNFKKTWDWYFARQRGLANKTGNSENDGHIKLFAVSLDLSLSLTIPLKRKYNIINNNSYHFPFLWNYINFVSIVPVEF